MRHRTTDPACIFHHPPRSRIARWRYERARGRCCLECERIHSKAIANITIRHSWSGLRLPGCPCRACRPSD